MKLEWESKNMAWAIGISLTRRAFYVWVTFAGIDLAFHIHNLRDIIYDDVYRSLHRRASEET